MTQSELREKFLAEKPTFSAWGEYVTKQVIERISSKVNINEFFKIPPAHRVKDVNSFIEKAFYRPGKNYTDPYNQITDKVGTRFVVLLEKDIELVKQVIEENQIWMCSLDRDYLNEKNLNPTVFEYQSVHYIVYNKNEIVYNGVSIPVKTPCEIQIRTLLQHAYSELTHNTVYKPSFKAPEEVYRLIAKSMALIEVTNDLFGEVAKTIEMKYEKDNQFLSELKKLYSEIADVEWVERLNVTIFEAVRNINEELTIDTLKQFIEKYPDIPKSIKERWPYDLLYRQPIVLMLFYLVENHRNVLRIVWPYTEDMIQPIFDDLGISFT